MYFIHDNEISSTGNVLGVHVFCAVQRVQNFRYLRAFRNAYIANNYSFFGFGVEPIQCYVSSTLHTRTRLLHVFDCFTFRKVVS